MWKKKPSLLFVPEGANVSRNRRLIFHRRDGNLRTTTQQPRVHKIMQWCLCTQPRVLTPAWWVPSWSSLIQRERLQWGDLSPQSVATLIESRQSSNHLKTQPFLMGITGNLVTSLALVFTTPRRGLSQGHYHNRPLFPAWRNTNTLNSHCVCRTNWLLEWNVWRANTHKSRDKNTPKDHSRLISSKPCKQRHNTDATMEIIFGPTKWESCQRYTELHHQRQQRELAKQLISSLQFVWHVSDAATTHTSSQTFANIPNIRKKTIYIVLQIVTDRKSVV